MKEMVFTVRGMDCAACAAQIESKLKSLKGVRTASVNFGSERLRLEYAPEAIDPDAALSAIKELGFEATLAFIHSSDTAAADLTDALKTQSFDIVMIGAGVRKDDDHFLVFERLVNVVHELVPQARIAFNTGPTDSDAAILRWA